MIFPYTYTSKIVQFPFKLHFKNHWMFPWFMGAAVMVSPIFYLIQKAGNYIFYDIPVVQICEPNKFFFLANCEANVKIWAEKRRKEEEHYKHKWD